MQKFTGTEYLKIDIANSFGHDQLLWADRIAWFDANESSLEQQVAVAKEPAQFLAGVLAYRDTQVGLATGYLCGLDATASGLQLLSVLSGCAQSGVTCNLVSPHNRYDAYTVVYNRVCGILGVQPSAFPISRKQCKNALMTHLYGSKAVPRDVFGEGSDALAAFYQAVGELMPGADTLNQELLSLWNPSIFAHEWVLPDGFDARIKVMDYDKHQVEFLGMHHTITEKVNRPKDSSLSLGANIVHSVDGMVVREMSRRCNYDVNTIDNLNALLHNFNNLPKGYSTIRRKDIALLRILSLYEMSDFMPAVIFEYLDQANMGHLDAKAHGAVLNLLDSLPEKPFRLLAIHDCFKFHANYGNDVRQQYINILAELAESDTLDMIVGNLTGRLGVVRKLSSLTGTTIRQSEYALS